MSHSFIDKNTPIGRHDNGVKSNRSHPFARSAFLEGWIHNAEDRQLHSIRTFIDNLRKTTNKTIMEQDKSMDEFTDQKVLGKMVTKTIDAIYLRVCDYASRFNDCLLNSSDLLVSGTPPSFVSEIVTPGNAQRRMIIYFRCRFSTRYLSLVMRGADKVIDVFLVPADETIALSRSEYESRNIARLIAHPVSEYIVWKEQDASGSLNMDDFAMHLFETFVTQTLSYRWSASNTTR